MSAMPVSGGDPAAETLAAGVRHQIRDHAGFAWGTLLRRWEVLLLAVLVLVIGGAGSVLPHFLDPYNLADSTFNFSEKALMALPIALLIIVREIDISVSAILALSSLCMGWANTQGWPAGLLALTGVLVGAFCGTLNGLLVTRLAIPSIVVTIGTMSLFRGITQVALGDRAYTGYPEALADWGGGYFFGMIPREFVVLLLCAALFGAFLHGTVHGRRLFAIGANPMAARFAGIGVERYRLLLFVVTGAMAGLAAVLLTGRIGSTRPNIAVGWELDAITMVILGGVSISGGNGSMGGVLLAVLALGMVTYALGMANVPGIIMTIVVGALLLITITVPVLLRRGPARRH